MKKITFSAALPHLIAVVIFFAITVSFFNPVFFENKTLDQYDITMHAGSSKTLRDFRDATGEEGLWAGSMFSGMPAYLVNLKWSDGVVVTMKRVLSLFLPHPVCNIFLAFVCYYILLLSFRVRPYLAIAGAIAFGLSSYMIGGLSAGHNARIGAIAFMPLVVAGIHLAFDGRRLLGAGLTGAGLALHLRENHLQITYYLLMIVGVYGLVQLIRSINEKRIPEFLKTLGLLVPIAFIAAGTFFGQFWAVTEYSRYSIRGASELRPPVQTRDLDGLSKAYAFEFNNAFDEPMVLIIPNYYGGSSGEYFYTDRDSKTYQALVNAGSQEVANQLAQYTSAYWGGQRLSMPYYAGALICVMFVIGIFFTERKYVWWLVSLSVISIMLTWGSNFSTLNYFLFDNLPGYNKFRSVTFALIIILFAMPLLGALGMEKLFSKELTKDIQRKLWWCLAVIPGMCLLLVVSGGFGSFVSAEELELPAWFRTALREDRMSLMRADAWRTFWFSLIGGVLIFAGIRKWIGATIVFLAIAFLVFLDMSLIDKRYFPNEKFRRKRDAGFQVTAADQKILADPDYFRVYNLEGTMAEASTSYFHNSIGGYHGAKLRRYQELYDSCIFAETREFIQDIQQGNLKFENYGVLNMLNIRYIKAGDDAGSVIFNPSANGPAWFVSELSIVNSPTEELSQTGEINTRLTAVIDGSKFKVNAITSGLDSAASIRLVDRKPNQMKYESTSEKDGFVIFSEIYYPKGWKATIDGGEVPLLRADYVLRALEVPAGKHVIELKFEPEPYTIGNKVTMASSWILLVIVAGCMGWSVGKGE